jgi:hypothetical protein
LLMTKFSMKEKKNKNWNWSCIEKFNHSKNLFWIITWTNFPSCVQVIQLALRHIWYTIEKHRVKVYCHVKKYLVLIIIPNYCSLFQEHNLSQNCWDGKLKMPPYKTLERTHEHVEMSTMSAVKCSNLVIRIP